MKRFLSLLVLVAMVFVQVPISSAYYDDYGEPNLIVTSPTTYNAEAGDSVNVSLRFENKGNGYASEITGNLASDPSGMVYVDGPSFDSVSSIRPGSSGSLDFNVKVDKLAEGKNYILPLTVSYYNEPDNRFLRPGDEGYIPAKKYDFSLNVNIRVSNKGTSTKLGVTRVDIMPGTKVNAGDLVVVGFEIQNQGTGIARDIKLSLSGLSSESFVMANGLNSKAQQSLEPGRKKYVYFELKSSERLGAGSYELGMNLAYKDAKGESYEDSSKFFIEVGSNKGRSSSLIMENIKYPTGSLGQNKDVDISFDLVNTGKSEAKDIVILADSKDLQGLVPKSVSTIKLKSLKPGERKEVSFKFLTTKSGETKNYPIDINVSYSDDFTADGEKQSINQFIGVFVVAPPEPGDPIKSTPRLIIDKYEFEPTMVKAGENFEMKLSFYNTNSSRTVKNIKIFLTAEANTGSQNTESSSSSVFTPVDSSNTFYIDSIPPKGKVEKNITMFTIPDAAAKTHVITANFEYEDNKGEAFTATELIGVPVVQQSRLEVDEIQYPTEAFLGEGVSISTEFYNTGKVTLYNMMVRLEGNFQKEGGSYYVGNFQSGNSEFFEGTIIPNEPGQLSGELVFSYEDSTGQEQELREAFSINIVDMPMEEFPDDFPMEEPQGNKFLNILKSKWLWIPLGLILAGVFAFKLYKKKQKEKEDSFLDE